ncbi:hypothetical protein [Orbus mooreae]|uniref:hypothetical protein n=1 Tax=Orbus mooreae TaxID=3074107 RepID=UPI00370D976A
MMTWEQVYNDLSEVEKQIMELASSNHIDLTNLANLQFQKHENDTNSNEVIYGRD